MAQVKELLVNANARVLGTIYGTLNGSITGSAAKWTTGRKLSWTGDATGSMTVDGSADKSAALTLANSGVTAGSYGPSANATPAHSGTFSVPQITVDAKGRVTSASTKTITLPASGNTDTKNTAGSTDTSSKIFLIGATSQAVNPQTYSHNTAYVGTDGCLYSNSTKVSVEGHTHSYAGASSAGGSATSAVKLDTATAGSATQPVYFSGGKPVATTYTLGKSVPSNAVFTDTTYSNMTAATASAAGKAGLVPAPAAGKQTSFLRGDGTWVIPTNTTYSAATTSAAGLMSAADKTKLNGIATGANAYSLPTASSSTLGGVKTTSTVTSTSGLTACPIISGVPYYKDTNTTYSLSSFGITATAAELNYTDGVTSNIQTQLNGKAESSHTHSYAGSSSAGGSATSAATASVTVQSNNNTYYPVVVTGTSTDNKTLSQHGFMRYLTRGGSSTSEGVTQLYLGTNVASTSSGGATGSIILYTPQTYYTNIVPASTYTGNRTYYLREISANGSFVMTTETDGALGSSTTPVYMSGYKLAACSGVTVPGTVTASSATHTGYGTNNEYVMTKASISYWNGAYDAGGNSNLAYCAKGAFASGATREIQYGTAAPASGFNGTPKNGDIYIQI